MVDKTLAAIAVMGAAYQMEKIDRVLVIAPTSVCSVWGKELEEMADFPFMVQTLLGDKGNASGRYPIWKDADI